MTQVTRREFDSRNRLTADIDAAGGASRTEYNALGKESALIDKNGNRTTIDYDANGRKSKVTYSDGSTELMSYDEEGNLTSMTDRSGRVTTHTYDGMNRPTRTTFADGTFTTTEYDAAGKTICHHRRAWQSHAIRVRPAGHKTRMIDAAGNTTTYTPNAVGRNTSVTDPNGHTTSYQYDALDRVTRTTYHDGTFTTTTLRTRSAARRKDTDRLGRSANYTYDTGGRLDSRDRSPPARCRKLYLRRGRQQAAAAMLPDSHALGLRRGQPVHRHTLPLASSRPTPTTRWATRLTHTIPGTNHHQL